MTYFIPILYLFMYALLHSILAMGRVKTQLYRLIPQSHYRLSYTILSILLLLPFPFLPWPSGHIYQISPPQSYMLHAIQLIGFAGFLWSLHHTVLGDFLGWAHLKPSPLQTQLVTTGPYHLCRHPLYFFGSLIFVAHPQMSHAHLVLTLWLVIYFWMGSYIEERRLLHQFGHTYQTYQETTPRFIPFL
ncbi:MAG: isoprenylcysteine carboxylmethyltransferase family protein [Candidatus Latescibacteria bacterium]|jgi:methanethiol S-methyltransferase|nr:isoprenylcysteine carboxylmethyltransferase family protein [Candidatus Latescibacterota bacterium]